MRNRHFLILDAAGFAVTPPLVLLLRFEGVDWLGQYVEIAWTCALATLPVRILIAQSAGLYRCLWQHASIMEAERLLAAGAVSGLAAFVMGAWLLPLLGSSTGRMPYSPSCSMPPLASPSSPAPG